VFNCHFYESARFEQARVFQCLSLGTPVISERSARAAPPSQFEDCVFWVAPDAAPTHDAVMDHGPWPQPAPDCPGA
jgi:hypothetical protein